MAQHDYVIDNQTSSAFRVDLNNALAAIASQNSGDAEPSTPFANQIWYDTLLNLLKQRNESNSAWVTLGTVNESAGKFEPNQTFATQAEAEAGTIDTVAMTPLKTKQATTARISSQAQAEAGTDDTVLMTPLKTKQAITALAPSPTTATVLAATAGATAGAVGVYGWLVQTSAAQVAITIGTSYAGSSFRNSGIFGTNAGSDASLDVTASTPSGTWRAMGQVSNTAGIENRATLFLRIS